MYNSWYEPINHIQQQLDQQAARLIQLEEKLKQISQPDQNSFPAQNQTTIEKLEYHFDQLKIERMDGTLQIGLTPDDIGRMDDFSVPLNEKMKSPQQSEILKQLNEAVGEKVMEQQAIHNLQLSYKEIQAIVEDVRKQIPERIAYYQQTIEPNQRDLAQSQQEIISKVDYDIGQSLDTFFHHKQTEGGGN